MCAGFHLIGGETMDEVLFLLLNAALIVRIMLREARLGIVLGGVGRGGGWGTPS